MNKYIFSKNRQVIKSNIYKKAPVVGCLFVCLAVHSGAFAQEYLSKEKNKNTSKFRNELLYKKDSVLDLYTEKNKYKFLNLLPNANYNISSQSVSFGLSLTNLSNFYQQKHRNKILLLQLEDQLNENIKKEVDALSIQIDQFNNEYQTIKNSYELTLLSKDIYQINLGKYQNSEISIERFLNYQKSYFNVVNTLYNKIFSLRLKAEKIKNKCDSYDYIKRSNELKKVIDLEFSDSNREKPRVLGQSPK